VPKVFVVLRGHVEQRMSDGAEAIFATGVGSSHKYGNEHPVKPLLLPLVEVGQGSGLLRPWHCVGHTPTRSRSDSRNESGDAARVVFRAPESYTHQLANKVQV
jgi:hypothetical protein